MKNNYAFQKNNKLYGISLYTTYNITNKYDVYLRYDKLYSNTIDDKKWNIEKDGQKIIAGITYSPIKYIRISANYQDWILDKVELKEQTTKVY